MVTDPTTSRWCVTCSDHARAHCELEHHDVREQNVTASATCPVDGCGFTTAGHSTREQAVYRIARHTVDRHTHGEAV